MGALLSVRSALNRPLLLRPDQVDRSTIIVGDAGKLRTKLRSGLPITFVAM
jgi:hypothetical protein